MSFPIRGKGKDMSTKLKITDMTSLKYINNQHQLDIASAALTHVTHGNSLIRKMIRGYLRRLSKGCNVHIDPEWINSHSGLIAGDWKHFKTNKR
ncbi:MAG: hypothetical protein KAR20_02705 [Candidatus Heimdallarchaeota archaeon]|nr:hypothetical protein [Candidatus Heimdallarchaeota archaeon]